VIRDPRAFWRAWTSALLWLGVIAVESTSLLSSQHTSRILYPPFHFLFGLDWEQFKLWHFLLRKTGHVLGYGLLSILLFRAWRVTILRAGNPRWSIAWASVGFLMTVLVASLDEWHQSFLPSRTGTVHDVVLDSAAAFAAQLLLFFWMRKKTDAPPGVLSNA
jgi:VanZ family protein